VQNFAWLFNIVTLNKITVFTTDPKVEIVDLKVQSTMCFEDSQLM